MGHSHKHVSRLIQRDGPHCHYCNRHLWRSQGTRDHVVPKSFGGIGTLENFVLACRGCNELRGNDLNWCDCDFCGPLISEYKSSPGYFERQFAGIIAYNRPVVKRSKGLWKVYMYPNGTSNFPQEVHSFKDWNEAIHFALTYGKQPSRRAIR